jgi:hypothetical protein
MRKKLYTTKTGMPKIKTRVPRGYQEKRIAQNTKKIKQMSRVK